MNLRTQYLTRNACYTAGKALRPVGVMVHSTGANNPNVSRYVPGDSVIGCNTSGNHWNQPYPGERSVCVHAFVGRFADGSVGTVQTLPWTMRGWHAGKSKGNNQYIGFEICEDGLDDPGYFAAVYREAVELVAYLCRKFGFDPLQDGVVICHAEGYRRGVASNHGDVLHWFPRHGKSMDDFRADVARILKGEEEYEVRYNTVDEIQKAAPWAEKTIRKMIDKGFISGGGKKDANGDPADMDLSMDMIRMMVMLNSAGAF